MEKIWNCAKEIYDKIDVLKPKTLNENIAEVRECLKSYVNDQVTFICELPSLIGKDTCSANEPVKNPYRKQSIVEMNQFTKEQIQSDISELCDKAIDITEKSFELSRKKATEILMFHLSTSDREKSANGIEQTPIAYAMNGSSLSTNVMRNLIEKV